MRKRLLATMRGFMAIALTLLATNILPMATVFADPPANNKVFVCKYVGTPHVDERLQTGTNPISVAVSSIQQNQWNGQVPGYFSDAHDRSYVLSYDNTAAGPAGDPDVSECPAPQGPPTEVSAGIVTYVDLCGTANDSFTVPTTEHVTYSKPAGTYTGVDATGAVTVTASANQGYVLTSPYTFSHTFTNVSCENEDTPTPAGIVTFDDVCGTEKDTYTVPNTQHVTYMFTGTSDVADNGKHDGSGTVSITAVADQGYTLTGQTVFAHTFTNEECPAKKVFVCKYVGTPGVDERLQTGQNPISVSVSSIEHNQWDGTVPGWFSDAHDRSYVLAYDVGQPEPDVSECPDNEPGKVTPAVVFTNPSCEVPSGRVTVTAMNGVTYKVNGSEITGTTTYPAGSSVTVEVELADGYVLADGATDEFQTTFAAAPTDCVLGEVTPPGGQGGEVLGETTVLADTGEESALTSVIFGIIGVAMAAGLALLSRKQNKAPIA